MNSALPPRFVLESAEKVSRGLDSQLFNNERSRDELYAHSCPTREWFMYRFKCIIPLQKGVEQYKYVIHYIFNEIETFKPKIVFNILLTKISLFKRGVWWGGSCTSKYNEYSE